MKLNVYNTPGETIKNLADYFVKVCRQAIADSERFSVALSGGSSPKKLYELLATHEYKSRVEWSRVYFFFGDERYVPQTHKDSNFLMAKQALFEPLQISAEQIFAVDIGLTPIEAAKDYETLVSDFFLGKEMRFDLVLLGLGDNAHTASLFPQTYVLHDTLPGIKAVSINELQAYRVTLNAPLINNALHIAFLVYSKEKAEAVYHILKDKKDVEKFPGQLIKTDESVEWFLDKEAASLVV